MLQAKLALGQPGDRYEQEADRVADVVMRMPEPHVQRKKGPDEEEEEVRAKPLARQITTVQRQEEEKEEEQTSEEEEEEVRAKPLHGTTPAVKPDLEMRIKTLRNGSSRPLDPATRAFMEPRFGCDFSEVRIHTGSRATESARALHARAFTVGKDVVFGAGQYDPGAVRGKRLLAHELTHVVQQPGGVALKPYKEPPKTTAEPTPADKAKGPDKDAAPQEEPATKEEPGPAAGDQSAPAETPPPEEATGEEPAQEEEPAEEEKTEVAAEKEKKGPNGEEKAAPQASADDAAATTEQEEAASAAPGPGTPGGARQAIGALTRATPTAFVDRMAGAGAELTAAAQTEEHQAHASRSEFRAHLPGGEPPPKKKLAAPGAKTQLEEGAAGPEAEPQLAPEKAAPASRARRRKITGGPGESAEAQYGKALGEIPETAGVGTDPGPAPKVALSGAADPSRAATQTADADAKMAQAGAELSQAIAEGPGAEQVQPVEVDETYAMAEAAVEAIPEAPLPSAAQEYAAHPVEADVRARADQILQPDFQAHLAAADEQMQNAVEARDQERAAAVEDAQASIDAASAEARQEQDLQVGKARGDIQARQEETRSEQEQELGKVRARSQAEHQQVEQQIKQRRQKDDAQIAGQYESARQEARAEKKKAEQKAQRKKQEAEKDKDQSFWGKALSAVGDFLTAIADAVTAVFDVLAQAVTAILNKAKEMATALIDAAVAFATSVLDALGQVLQGLVDTLIGSFFPELAAKLNAFIESAVASAKAAVTAIGEKLKAGVNAAIDGLNAVVQKTLQVFKTAITTGLAFAAAVVTGDFEGAFRALLEGALSLAGISPDAFYGFVGSAMDVILEIVRSPGTFLLNLLKAVKTGFGQFAANFAAHLKTGFFEWIVGPLGEMGISLPKTWDLKGIFGLVLEVLGVTREGVRKVIVEVLGEGAGGVFDFVMKYLDALMEGGVAGLWQELQSDLSGLWQMVVDGIKDWLMTKIVQQAVTKIVTLFNPVGAIVQVLLTAWGLFNFLRENLSKIWGVVKAVVDGIAQIVKGAVGPVANLVEQQLAKLIPMAISFLANLLGLGGITKVVRGKIEAVREFIFGLMKKLISKVKGLFKGKKGKSGSAESATKGDEQIGKDITFTVAGESHRMFYREKGDEYELFIRSNLHNVRDFLTEMKKIPGLPSEVTKEAARAYNIALNLEKTSNSKRKTQDEPGKMNNLSEKMITVMNACAIGAAPKGTVGDPIPIVWHKRFVHECPPIECEKFDGSIAGVRATDVTWVPEMDKHEKEKNHSNAREELNKADMATTDANVAQKAAELRNNSHIKKYRIGVHPKWQVRPGTIVGPKVPSGSRKEEDRFRKYAGPWLKMEGRTIDHVTDLVLSGPDAQENLWPVPWKDEGPKQKINLAAKKDVAILANENKEVTGKSKELEKLEEKYYFIIR